MGYKFIKVFSVSNQVLLERYSQSNGTTPLQPRYSGKKKRELVRQKGGRSMTRREDSAHRFTNHSIKYQCGYDTGNWLDVSTSSEEWVTKAEKSSVIFHQFS